MADEDVTPPVAPETPVEATPAPAAPNYDERFAKLEQSQGQIADALRALASQGGGQQQQGAAPSQGRGFQVPDDVRTYLRAQGLTDEAIDHNAALVLPFVHAGIRQAAPEVAGAIGQVYDDVTMMKASRDTKNFPDWDTVSEKVAEIRETAKKTGQNVTVRQAYEAAVALDPEAVTTARQAKRANAAAADATAQHLGGNRGRAASRGATSADDLRSMTRDERKAFFEKHGDVPIH